MITKSELAEVIKEFPGLRINSNSGVLYLEGVLEITHPHNEGFIDSFLVEIYFPEKFPFCFPLVIETSEKIERIPDRHINAPYNTLCLTVDFEEQLLCAKGITVSWFIKTILIPRLAEEHRVNNGGKYFHELPHGAIGKLRYLSEMLKANTPSTMIEVLNCAIQFHEGTKIPHLCFCGSHKQFKKCHSDIINKIRLLSIEQLKIHKNWLIDLEHRTWINHQNKNCWDC